MEFDLVNNLGIIGLIEVLYAYAMLSMKKWKADTMAYQVLNINGSIFLAINAYAHGAMPVLALNVIWALIGFYAVGKMMLKKDQGE